MAVLAGIADVAADLFGSVAGHASGISEDLYGGAPHRNNFRMFDDATGSVYHAQQDQSLVKGYGPRSDVSSASHGIGGLSASGDSAFELNPTPASSELGNDDLVRPSDSSGDPTGNLLGVEFDPSEVNSMYGRATTTAGDDEITPFDSVSNSGRGDDSDPFAYSEDSDSFDSFSSSRPSKNTVADRVTKSDKKGNSGISGFLSHGAGGTAFAATQGAFSLIGQSMKISAEESILNTKISSAEYMQQAGFTQQTAMQNAQFGQF